MRCQRCLQLLIRLTGFLSGVCTGWLVLTSDTTRHHTRRPGGNGSGQLDAVRQLATTIGDSIISHKPVAVSDSRASFPRIFCMILTHPKQYRNMAMQVNNTWARRCNKYLFIGSESTNISIPLLNLPLRESRSILWKKVRMAFLAVYAQERLDDFDYFLKADDDTFVLMENLRHLLSQHDPSKPAVFGRRFAYQGDNRQQYMSGGAGYVLSRRALQLLVSAGFGSTKAPGITDYCNVDYISVEDYLMGRCLRLLGVKFEYSLDELKRERFHPLRPETMVNPRHSLSWIHQYNYYPFQQCRTCISNTSISFHYVDDVLELEFLLYHTRVAN